VESLCDRVGVIIRGELRSLGTVSELVGERVEYFDCVFADVDADADLPGKSFQIEQNRLRVRVGPEQLDEVLKKALGMGGRVVQVQPWRLTLEDVLVDEIQNPGGSEKSP
jgi:ABC-2 type transport system ATP-binding protein